MVSGNSGCQRTKLNKTVNVTRVVSSYIKRGRGDFASKEFSYTLYLGAKDLNNPLTYSSAPFRRLWQCPCLDTKVFVPNKGRGI